MANKQNLPASPKDALMEAFKKDLEDISPYLETLMPKTLVPRFKRMTQVAVLRNPDLLLATKKSLLLALLWCAEKNMEPGVEDGVWLLVFKVKGVPTVTPVPAYKGLIKKAIEIQAARSIDAFPVYEHDDFYYCYGLEPELRHAPPKLGSDRGELVGAYTVITLPNGDQKFKVMDMAEIEQRRDASASWRAHPEEGPWEDWKEGMALKTVIKNGLKTVPMKADLRDLLSDDGMIEAGATVGALLQSAGAELPEELKGADMGTDIGTEVKADSAPFDNLVLKELSSLSPDEAAIRAAHLDENAKLSAKTMKKTVPMFKAWVVENNYFHPYKNDKGEAREGYWKSFLSWEADPERPWNKKGEPLTPLPPSPDTTAPADTTAPVVEGEVDPWADRKKAVVMAILGKTIPLPDLDLTRLDDITPENIGDIEKRVEAWQPPKTPKKK